ncbi:OmpA family protein [Segetibacter sp. 3557_3]|uniref:OmpA family protein n=1 Tax=Segetibacter sp. 3557_3 TaxID=2547429 RepID=UPI001404A187|nr:OmpA family protein [Segetibacter sp. 3557_3]
MKKILVAAFICTMPFTMQAQLKGMLERAKYKANQRLNSKADEAIDKALDQAEGKNQPKPTAKEESSTKAVETEEKTKAEPAGIKAYSKFDFVPGEKVLYTEDFAQDVVGELPVNWNSSGKGEVMTIENKEGKWLRIFQGNTYLTGNTKSLGENYTAEFDMIYYFKPKLSGYLLPSFTFGIFSSATDEPADNKFLQEHTRYNSVEVDIHPGSNAGAALQSYKLRQHQFSSARLPLDNYTDAFNKVVHFAVQVQKTRFRLWVNDTKVFDIPRAVNIGDTMNQLVFKMEGSNYKDEEVGLFLKNIKLATGVPDTRHKLIEEGKFSTTGILFDFQSAVIKPESYGVVKEISGVLKENAGVKIKVIGHTSNDGDANANLELSKQRAAAVKDLLVKEFGIEEARLQTDGKGASQPVADNKTKEGKAQNRRVEFVKL